MKKFLFNSLLFILLGAGIIGLVTSAETNPDEKKAPEFPDRLFGRKVLPYTADLLVNKRKVGVIDWGCGRITVEGQGRSRKPSDALDKAKASARERMQQFILEVRIAPGLEVWQLENIKDEIPGIMEKAYFVKNSEEKHIDREVITVKLRMALDFYGENGLCAKILPKIKPLFDEGEFQIKNEIKEIAGRLQYTDFMVDARNTGVKPCLLISIKAEDDWPVTGPGKVGLEKTVQAGMVRWCSFSGTAEELIEIDFDAEAYRQADGKRPDGAPRIRPYVVYGMANRNQPGQVWLPRIRGRKFLEFAEADGILREGRVMIVAGERPQAEERP